MVNFVVLIIIAILAFLLFFSVSSRRDGNKKYREALDLEEKGQHKEACLNFAIAVLNGSTHKKECKKRIKNIWHKHGPFDYSDDLEKEKVSDNKYGCGEAGYKATVSIIEEIVKSKRDV